ncbi:hypothetical protein [Acidianus bottle-shaped virus 3 strain ABV3]|uniref:Uncharacterized protein n=1 Tax=Acidianus bottle-shaped virus 3 strain ABV3 TaxID=1732174 RepID=A0A0N9PB04_9VIRU|nr:hypothetical protein AVU00_gp29 [Acidianus bottle-shaped virus 3 strain ABV3]ALG96831.1 hypothetical protein [Acidianus bottle-shaped virus 3 strain ABV3]
MLDWQIAILTLLGQGKKVVDSTWWSEVENQHVKVKVQRISNGYEIVVNPKDEIGEMIKETWENMINAMDEDEKRNYKAILQDLILNF